MVLKLLKPRCYYQDIYSIISNILNMYLILETTDLQTQNWESKYPANKSGLFFYMPQGYPFKIIQYLRFHLFTVVKYFW